MYFSPATNRYIAVNCDTNNYGAPSMTPGLAANPCRNCPSGLQTSTSINSSAAFWATDGAGKQGFTNQLACVTQAGFGYNGRVATKVRKGSVDVARLTGLNNKTTNIILMRRAAAPSPPVQCSPGSYNPPGGYGPCSSCPIGLTTLDNATRQVSADDCTVAIGYGFHGGSIVACPVGEFLIGS